MVAGAEQSGPGDLVDVVERVAELGHGLHDVVGVAAVAPPTPSPHVVDLCKEIEEWE